MYFENIVVCNELLKLLYILLKILSTIKNELLDIYQMKYWNTVYGDILGLDLLKFILHKLKSSQQYKDLSYLF